MNSIPVRAYLVTTLVLGLTLGPAIAQEPPVSARYWCQVWGTNANDGPAADRMFADWVAEALHRPEWNKEVRLKQLLEDWNTPFCVTDGGWPRLGSVLKGLDNAFYFARAWSKSRAMVDRLHELSPRTAPAAIAEAEYWIRYAWNARGGGYASSVSQDGWKLFQERLEQAERVLVESKAYAADVPVWHQQMIRVQSALGRPAEERNGTFAEGVKTFRDYLPLYADMAVWLTPKWGGSWESVDQFIAWSVEYTKPFMDNAMYARLYWAVSSSITNQANLFGETKASWPKMKAGFEDIMKMHPRSRWNQNNFAKFACIAGDRDTYLAVRKLVGKDVMTDAWPQSIDLCDSKFGYAQDAP